MLTPENYTKGFLMDDELMAGVSPHPETPNMFCAFVLQHRTGEYLGYEFFQSLDPALAQINSIQRPWSFEKVGGCGGCDGGKCGEGACSREGGGGCCKT